MKRYLTLLVVVALLAKHQFLRYLPFVGVGRADGIRQTLAMQQLPTVVAVVFHLHLVLREVEATSEKEK